MSYSVEVITSIKNVSRNDWNRLSHTLLTEHAWHSLVEDAKVMTITPRHILVRKDKKLVAAAATYVQHDALGNNMEESLFGQHLTLGHLLGLKLNPCLLCYAPMSVTGPGFLFDEKLTAAQQQKVFTLILDEMKRIAKQEKVASYGFLNPRAGKAFDAAMKREGLDTIPLSAEVFFDIKWDSFDGYLGSFLHNRRRQFKHELKVNKEKGIVTEELLRNHAELKEVSKVFNETYEKYRPGTAWLDEHFLKLVEKHFPGRVLIVTDRKDGKLVTASLNIFSKDEMLLYRLGKNHEIAKGSFSTFVTALYTPIKFACEHGIRRVNAGTSTYGYKLARGGYREPVYLHLKAVSPVRGLLMKPALFLLGRIKRRRHFDP